jgi:hypothetical protein
MTHDRTMSEPPKAIPATPGAGLFVLAIALIPLIHLFFLLSGKSAVLDGFLPGQDSYMRLVRVEQLYQTGDWYDGTLARSNWPYGEVQNWTRPADVMMLSGALLLEPFLGFRQALYWWGSATAPLLHVATALALVWMVAPRFDRSRQFLVVLLFLVQIPVWQHGIFGRTDHHMLILLFSVLALGGALRVMVGPLRLRDGLLAGALAGFGLWLTIEFLLILAMIFAAFAIRWLAEGAGLARRYLWHGLGLVAMVAVALVAEHPPGHWFAEEYDRISAVHLLMALVATGFWAAAAVLEARGLAGGVGRRAVIAGLGAAAAAGVMLLVYPKFFDGPFVEFSKELWAISTDRTAEFQPLIPKTVADLGSAIMKIGPALVAVPYLAYRTWRARGRNLTDLWLLIALGLLVFLPLTLMMRRFAPFTAILLGLVMADLVAHLLDRMGAARSATARLGSVGLLVFVVFGHVAVGGILGRLFAPSPAQAGAPYCPMDVLIDELNRPEVVGPGRHAVLATPNFGPMILYFTNHAVVTTLYARNSTGQLDAFRIYTATDSPSARRLIEQRGIDLVVACIGRATYRDTSNRPDALDSRLRRGEAPDWLRPLALGETAGKLYRIYRVSPGAD